MTVTRPHPTGVPGYSETWPCRPESVARARGLVRVVLHTWSVEQLVDDGAVIVSELAGNAVRHSRCRLFRLGITLAEPGRVRLAVSDGSTAHPRVRVPRQDATTGRGLLLVGALADCWGTDAQPWGKTVWAELRSVRRPSA